MSAEKNTAPAAAKAVEAGMSSEPNDTAASHASQSASRRTTDDLAGEIAERLRATIRYYGGEFQTRTLGGDWERDTTDGGATMDELRRIACGITAAAATGSRREQSAASRERLRLESAACFASVRSRLRGLLRVARPASPRPIQTCETIAPTLAKFGIDEATIVRLALALKAKHGTEWNQIELRLALDGQAAPNWRGVTDIWDDYNLLDFAREVTK